MATLSPSRPCCPIRVVSAHLHSDTSDARRFSDWIAQHPDAVQAQPSDEHLLTLFTALGAAGLQANDPAVHRGIRDHVIAMDSYAFTQPA